jgi:hypothetical protein
MLNSANITEDTIVTTNKHMNTRKHYVEIKVLLLCGVWVTGCSMGVPKWRLDDLAHKIAINLEFLSTTDLSTSLIAMAFLLFLFCVVKHTYLFCGPMK